MSQVLRENDYYSGIVSRMEPVRKHANEKAFHQQTPRREAISLNSRSIAIMVRQRRHGNGLRIFAVPKKFR